MKFKVGDKLRVTKKLHGHLFNIGEVVIVKDIFTSDYKCFNGDDNDTSYICDDEVELVEENKHTFKIGDTVKITNPSRGYYRYRNMVGTIMKRGSYWHVRFTDVLNDCFRDSEMSLVSSEKGETMRKRYILLKETIELKKGCIVEEACDDGTQDFVIITPEFRKFLEVDSIVSRKAVTTQPKWFEEVHPLYVPTKQLAKVKKILKLK